MKKVESFEVGLAVTKFVVEPTRIVVFWKVIDFRSTLLDNLAYSSLSSFSRATYKRGAKHFGHFQKSPYTNVISSS